MTNYPAFPARYLNIVSDVLSQMIDEVISATPTSPINNISGPQTNQDPQQNSSGSEGQFVTVGILGGIMVGVIALTFCVRALVLRANDEARVSPHSTDEEVDEIDIEMGDALEHDRVPFSPSYPQQGLPVRPLIDEQTHIVTPHATEATISAHPTGTASGMFHSSLGGMRVVALGDVRSLHSECTIAAQLPGDRAESAAPTTHPADPEVIQNSHPISAARTI